MKKEPQQLHDGDIGDVGTVFYMPHQAVIPRDAISTKLRVVYDDSAKSSSELPGLNDSIHPGPSLILDILI